MPSQNSPTKLVYIRWKDAHYQEGEIPVGEIDQLCELHSVGFLIKDTLEAITISVEKPDGGFVRNPFSIPRVNVLAVQETTLRKAFHDKVPRKKPPTRSKTPPQTDTASLSHQDSANDCPPAETKLSDLDGGLQESLVRRPCE